ncbi:PBSX family phage terminase large subunit [Bacillus mycoides]|uniref:Phage terminase, large subunit n=13 Tax=root TaxID=1 RepID=I7ILV2_9CAUD|nr:MULTISPECIES: PBSX family phage terminase large subunit [Bacillus cereus group]YP_006560692.1 terminase large subunit [Staphylococcus phage SpaA1]YP_009099334.1 terminase large subunit [Bacillus phage Waukesha92]YP_009218135.1 terminase large subunit [Bacillus phage phi4J1]YP_009829815.1 terminase large subunit [Bacillus phage BceA1]ALO79894.1 PBSX family terminase large subunit [Bacillus phage phiS58]AID50258.1 terminase large subunit [Bacillus phage Waukesha92]AIE36875.1 Phage terminase
MKLKPAPFKFRPFSKKQLQVLTWWRKDSPVKEHDGIICDGSIRAGKTVSMALSYVMWGTETFNGENLGMAGKTIGSLRRNVITPLKKMLKSRKYKVKDHLSDNMLTISKDGHTNHFYIFGGKDESSQELIQGITLAGMFFDEVALMPQSFVNQATGRCSIEGSKYWFNCNPAGPYHWFKLEWIDNKEDKNLLHIHFTMDDNLSLSEKVKQRYYRMYSGVFFQRFILGLWVLAEGIVYDMFNKEKHVVKTKEREYEKYYVSCDYGTQNPMTYGLWGLCDGIWYKTKEYHYDGRKNSQQKTDDEYLDDLKEFVGEISIRGIIVDPSAASFIALLKKNRFKVIKAKNEVIDGIRNVARLLNEEKIKYNDCCKETFREYASYTWDEKATARGEDKPNKENDHQMDGDRYFVNTVVVTNNKAKAVKSIY